MKRILALLLAVCLLLTGCSGQASPQATESEQNTEAPQVTVEESLDCAGTDKMPQNHAQVADFGLSLLREAMGADRNVLISPVSVMAALSMTANGAKGNTLTQMEAALGSDRDALNRWYERDMQKQSGENLHLANAVFVKDEPGLVVNEDFLQTLETYYETGIHMTPFNEATLREINRFVEDNTDGMVKDILDQLPTDAVLYLVNALAFEGKWEEVYRKNQVQENTFTTENGVQQEVELMYSKEGKYLEDDYATGFIKYYADRRYGFVALLPKADVTVGAYVQSLTGEHLRDLLENARQVTVNAAIPKFETAFDMELGDILKAMGMTDAFDSARADFSAMATSADGNLFISRVLHKTFISVAEQGTKAGAATVIEVATEGAIEQDIKRVTLDRPFVYMILDTATNTPIFMGTLMNFGEEGFLFVEPNENGHVHSPVEEPELCAYPTVGYCGNIVTTVKMDGREYSFMYEDSVALTDILTNQLTFDPNLICRCIAPITVETELGGPYSINLEEGFARCAEGQANLTQAQVQTIQQIIEKL